LSSDKKPLLEIKLTSCDVGYIIQQL